MTADIQYRLAPIDDIYKLRFEILRPGQVPIRLHFPGDENQPPLTWHFGAFLPAGRNIACLTLLAGTYDSAPAIQLRGMAVAADFQGQGAGTKLLTFAQTHLQADPRVLTRQWWCNARLPAIPFYQRNGWQLASDEFHIEGVGPHRKMTWQAAKCGIISAPAYYPPSPNPQPAPHISTPQPHFDP